MRERLNGLRRGMKRRDAARVAALALAMVAVVAVAAQETDPTDGKRAYRFEELADGVWFATGTGAMTTMSNSLVIVNDDHAMLVDTSVTPAAARKLVAEVAEEITDLPIRYVFNTHFHFDHAHGNQIFEDDVEIVGHDYVRVQFLADSPSQRTNRSFSGAIPGRIEDLKAQVAGATDDAERAQLALDLRITEAHWNALQETRVKPPSVTFNDTMTIVKGGREVQLHHPGRGHTAGDALVFLPEERIVFTGDFFVGSPGANGLPYMGDGFVHEWPASLDRLKALEFDTIVPGHGTPFQEREQIDHLQAYLRDLWDQASKLRADGVSADDAAGRIDLSAHAAHYGDRVRSVDPRAVVRIYEVLQILHPM